MNDGNHYEGVYFELGADIKYNPENLTVDLDGNGENESNYTPIGYAEPVAVGYVIAEFRGTFDGKGHTVSGIVVNSKNNYVGLFGQATISASIKNLTVANSSFVGRNYVGGIVGDAGIRVILENCRVSDDVSVQGLEYIGGIVGINFADIRGCISEAKELYGEEDVGGIVGDHEEGVIENCLYLGTSITAIKKYFDGTITRYVGAISGSRNLGTFKNNYYTLKGMGGLGKDESATGEDIEGAKFAAVFSSKLLGLGNAGSPYGTDGYVGITPYDNGLEYKGKYYHAGSLVAEYAAVQIFEDVDGKYHAVIDGNYDGKDAVEISNEIDVKSVSFNRAFTKNAFSTVMFPFDVNTKNVEGLDMVLRFNGIGTDENGQKSVKMKIAWKPTKPYINLNANTPYMVLMNDEMFKVNGNVTIRETQDAVVTNGDWEFRGTWQFKRWDKGDTELGYAYGFAAATDDDIVAGEFVKVGVGAWINPMRAYLLNAADLKKSQNKAKGVRRNVNGAGGGFGVNGASVLRTSSVQEELPEVMNVIVEDEDAENTEKKTTVIGQFNTRTGQFKMNFTRGMFDAKGRRVNGRKADNARGAYYGKKVR